MKTSQSFGVHFTIRKGREKNGKTAVYASITINKEKVLIALKRFVDVDTWDKGHGCVKVRLPEAKETNAYLEDFAVDRLNIVRDIFVFSCYTGLSYVDLMNLKENNITAGEDGANWIKLFCQKSKRSF